MEDFRAFVDREYPKLQKSKAAAAALEAASKEYPDPDAAAAALKTGQKLGVPAVAALRNPQDLWEMDRQILFGAFARDYPYADWVLKHSPLLHDELEPIGFLTRRLDDLRSVGQGLVGDFAGECFEEPGIFLTLRPVIHTRVPGFSARPENFLAT